MKFLLAAGIFRRIRKIPYGNVQAVLPLFDMLGYLKGKRRITACMPADGKAVHKHLAYLIYRTEMNEHSAFVEIRRYFKISFIMQIFLRL